jgi:hypothetical protein|tara:strand:+ start:152 stop:577 length:426 start_codon:yes stop_codon:yes gene_type:complete
MVLLVSVLLFTFCYLLLGDQHFSGVNVIKETIKKELIKKKVGEKIDQQAKEGLSSMQYYENKANVDSQLKKATDVVKEDVEEDAITTDKIDTPIFQRFFDRLYFSIQNATLLGYGDIYPISNICKCFVILQSLFTISLIVY